MLDYGDEFCCGNGNGNKMNLRVEILENLLKASGDGTSAKVNSLRQAIHRCKTDMAETPGQSLDLLRQVFQSEMSEEIRQVIDRHIRTTFSPALENLRRNGFEIRDTDLNELCVNILEAAKKPYATPDTEEKERSSRVVIPAGTLLKGKSLAASKSKNAANPDMRRIYESDDNESDTSMASLSAASQAADDGRFNRPKKRGRPRKVDVDTGRSGTPIMQGTHPVSLIDASKWNPDRIHSDSKFILASKVNKLLSMGHRGHIFVKYPRILRYVADDEDKSWLFDKNISTRMSGKVFFMLLEDVMELAILENSLPNVRNDIQRSSFVLPDKFIAKIKAYMAKPFEQLKSRIAPASPLQIHPAGGAMISPQAASNSHQQQQQHQPQLISPNTMSAAMTNMAIRQHQQQHDPNRDMGANSNLPNHFGLLNGASNSDNLNLTNSLMNLLGNSNHHQQQTQQHQQFNNQAGGNPQNNPLANGFNNLQMPPQQQNGATGTNPNNIVMNGRKY